MRIRGIFVVASVVFALSFLPGGCSKPDDQTAEETGTDSAQSESPAVDSDQSTATPVVQTADAASELDNQIEQVRAAFLSLQQICKDKDADGYAAFWDHQTKKEIDGRDLTVAQRQERRRQAVLEKPEKLDEIANATIESIEVNTVHAERLEEHFGHRIEGTMIVVSTDGRALLFHETADGWKLFSVASSSYFREGQ